MALTLKAALALATAVLMTSAVHAQVPTVDAPGSVVDALESIAVLPDTESAPGTGAVVRKLFAVPSGRTFRLTDVSVDPRNANTTVNPCFFEVWRGTDAQPVALAWSRMRIFTSSTYDRSWITGPQFNEGETVWVIGRFDPFNSGLRICARNDPNLTSELRYALRGYLLK